MNARPASSSFPSIVAFLPRAFLAAAVVLAAGAARAQGTDDCASAQSISGTGVFPFDTTSATTGAEGQTNGNCLTAGQTGIARDLWFTWQAPTTGSVIVQTCTLASLDTKIAVYDGIGCPAAGAIACNDDACGLLTSVTFLATAGNDYTFQLGEYPTTAVGGAGSFSVAYFSPILATMTNPANGHTYHFLTPTTWTEAEGLAVSYGGHLVTIDDQAEQDWIYANFHSFGGVDRDIWLGLNDVASEGTFVWSSGAPVGFTNWSTGEPNDGGTGEDCATMRKNSTLGQWNDLSDVPNPFGFHNSVHGLVELGQSFPAYCFGDGSLPTPCPCANLGASGKGCENSASTGGAVLSASGTTSPDTVLLETADELPTALSIFLQGDVDLVNGVPFGDGVRCAGGAIKRLGVHNASGGATSYPQGADLPITQKSASLGDPIAPGTPRFYQTYYRDPNLAFCPQPQGNTWNATNAVRIDW